MADNNEAQNQGMPTPDPALKRLNRLVGTWSMKGHPIGPDEDSITGTTHIQMAAEGRMMTVLGFSCSRTWIWIMQVNQSSHELMGYNPKTKAFSSYVYSNMAPDPCETISTIHNARKSQVALQLRKGVSLVVIKKKRNCEIYHF